MNTSYNLEIASGHRGRFRVLRVSFTFDESIRKKLVFPVDNNLVLQDGESKASIDLPIAVPYRNRPKEEELYESAKIDSAGT